MIYNQRNFTIIEMLLAIAIIAILSAILLPRLSESQARARFVRWLQFNKQCSTDPSCVINLNFQEGEGNILTNSALGHEAEGFNAAEYNGNIIGDYEWGNGRWWKGKNALQLDGSSTFIEFPGTEHVNFVGENNFTVMISLKFDRLDKWDGIFGKCYMRNAVNGFPQYALYFDNSDNVNKKDSKMFQMDIGRTSVSFDDISVDGDKIMPINSESWYQLVMRNKIVAGKQVVDVFVNGVKLQSSYKNTGTGEKDRDEARLAVGCIRWLLKDKNNSNDADNRAPFGRPDNFLKGKIDEFLVYNRALTDNEIKAHYQMGAEHY